MGLHTWGFDGGVIWNPHFKEKKKKVNHIQRIKEEKEKE